MLAVLAKHLASTRHSGCSASLAVTGNINMHNRQLNYRLLSDAMKKMPHKHATIATINNLEAGLQQARA
eukprot:1153346-Pelagomonas_calceolata.AAC.1